MEYPTRRSYLERGITPDRLNQAINPTSELSEIAVDTHGRTHQLGASIRHATFSQTLGHRLAGLSFACWRQVLVADVVSYKWSNPKSPEQYEMITALIGDVNKNNSLIQRVLLIHIKSPLDTISESLLTQETNLHVLSIAPGSEIELLQAIEQYQPDVIVLDDALCVTNSTRLMTLFPNYSRLRVVGLNSENNLVQICNKYPVLVTQIADLIAVVNHP